MLTCFTKINTKQTKATDSQGNRYKAKEVPPGTCSGCAFDGEGYSCSMVETYCSSSGRDDGRSIIWKRRKVKPVATTSEDV